MTALQKAEIYYGGFAFRGGGAFMHAKVLRKELERAGWQVDLITLERLPLLVRYLPHLVGKIFNYFASPMGFYYKGRLTKHLYKLIFNRRVQLQVFQDIYISWNSRTPAVTMLHAVWSDNLQALTLEESAIHRLVAAEEGRIDSITHPVITVSDAYRDFLAGTHSGSLHLRSINVVPLGVDLGEFEIEHSPCAAQKSLVFCGSLEPRKNLVFLLSVFRRLQEKDEEYRLTIIGDGPDRDSLEHVCLKNNLAVTFLGRLERAAVIAELRRHNLYIHTSVKESFSLALLEAKLSGLTTIAYRGLEIPAEFIDIPVPSFNEEEWLEAVLRSEFVKPVDVDATYYSSQTMMVRTIELARTSSETEQ